VRAPCPYISCPLHFFSNRNRPEEAEDVLRLAIKFFLDPLVSRDTGHFNEAANTVVDLSPVLRRVVLAWAKSNRPDALSRIESLIKDALVMGSYKKSSLIAINPSSFVYFCYLECLIDKGGSAGLQAADVTLQKLVKDCIEGETETALKRDLFELVMTGWAKSNYFKKEERATELLNSLLVLDAKKPHFDCSPTENTFLICLNLWHESKKSQAAEKALAIVEMVEQRHLSFPTPPYWNRIFEKLLGANSQGMLTQAVKLLPRFSRAVDRLGWSDSALLKRVDEAIQLLPTLFPTEPNVLVLKLLGGLPQTTTNKRRTVFYEEVLTSMLQKKKYASLGDLLLALNSEHRQGRVSDIFMANFRSRIAQDKNVPIELQELAARALH
jgi:hypothetical protein